MKTIYKIDGSSLVPNVLANSMAGNFPFQDVDPILGIASLSRYYKLELKYLFQDTAGTIPANVGDPVGLWVEALGTGLNWEQGVVASKPTLRQRASGNYYLENATDWMSVPSSTASFKFLHDGTGGEVHIGANVDADTSYHALVANFSGNFSQVGAITYASGSGASTGGATYIAPGGAGYTSQLETAAGTFPRATDHTLGFSFETVGGLNMYTDGASIGSAATALTPSTASSFADIRLGRDPDNTNQLSGDISDIAFFDDVLSNEDRTTVSAEILSRMG